MKFKESFALSPDPEHSEGYDDEAVNELVREAVEYGMQMDGGKAGGMSMVFATMFIDGWCNAAGLDEAETEYIRDAVSNAYIN